MRVEFQIGAGKKGRKKAVQVTGPNGTAIRLFPESEALEATGLRNHAYDIILSRIIIANAKSF